MYLFKFGTEEEPVNKGTLTVQKPPLHPGGQAAN